MGRGHSPEAYRGRLRPGVLLGAAHQLIVPICRSATALARFVASVVAGVVMTVGALEAQPQIPSVTDPNRDAGRAGSEVLAVVPFVNISGDPADDWIGSGIAATVVADATRIGSVVLLPRPQTVASGRPGGRNSLATVGEALQRGRDLAADWLVTGGYQRVGDQVRITAWLVDAATGRVITSATVDGALGELFALQDRITAELNLAEPAAGAPDVPSQAASEPDLPPGRIPTGEVPEEGRGVAPTVPKPSADAGDPNGPLSVTGGITIGDPATFASGSERSAGVLVGRPTVVVPTTADVPRIDGRLDDALWGSAVRITEFVQQRPLDGAPASEETEIFVAYDSSNLYFGLYAHYSSPDLVRANRVDRDQTTLDDTIKVYFDPFLDQQRAFVFSVNGYGVQGDAVVNRRDRGSTGGRGRRSGGGGSGNVATGSVAPTGDPSWDALFASAGTLVADGWTAEMAIPFKSLRYPQRGVGEAHRWGFQIVRTIESKDESDVWAPISRDIAGFLPQMGVLEGLTGLSLSRNLEVMPTFIASQTGRRETTTGEFVNHDADPEAGVNVKYGVTSNLTFDFTYNPDFSQIETDTPQIEVNQRFPLNFPELRPFFLEGQEIFSIMAPVTLVQTRTIVDPEYGAKLTGKVGRMSMMVVAADDQAPGKVDDRSDLAFGKSAQVFLGRARYDLYSESHIGLLATNREFLDSHNRMGGIDGSFRIGSNHQAGIFAMGSLDRDREGVQRRGHLLQANVTKQGRNLSYFIAHWETSPDFLNDQGFTRRVDDKTYTGRVDYRWWPTGRIVNWGPRISYRRTYGYDNVLQDEQMGASVSVRFARNIDANVGYNRDMERFGGVDFWKSRFSFGGNVRTSRRFSFGGNMGSGDQIRFLDNPFLGSGTEFDLNMTLRPFSRLQSEITLDASRLVDPRDDEVVFDVKIWRALTTYQFTGRLLLRNIMEYNTFDGKLLANMLVTYRVSAGTVFFGGYDARYDQGNRINAELFSRRSLLRTNHTVFTKLQYLFRF